MRFRAWAPGRVNLIGEHTDYTGGLVFPMAIQLGTTVTGSPKPGGIELRSDQQSEPFRSSLPILDPTAASPDWGRYVAGVAAVMQPTMGLDAHVQSDVPPGAGLSSSAALEVAVALALQAVGETGEPYTPVEIAQIAQRSESTATGVPCGIMDQLASACGVAGHGLRIDCGTLEITPVEIPVGARIVVVHSGEHRTLVGSAYADRRSQCEAAALEIGPLRAAEIDDVAGLADVTLRKRARHVVSENARVDHFIDALSAGDLGRAGEIMGASHASLRDDFEVSTPTLDALVQQLASTPGVFGARLTGAGFGGCVVALCDPEVDPRPSGLDGWIVQPSRGAYAEVF